jgi:hypothetical protein
VRQPLGDLPVGRRRAAPDDLRPSASRQTSGRLRRSVELEGPKGAWLHT